MRKNRHWLLTMAMLLSSIMVSAHDFEVDGIYYNILSSTDLTVEVTFRGDEPGYYTDTYTGDVILKSDVTYNGKNYKVVGIGFNAFLVNFELKSITIPESITSIGEASFAMCSSLTSVTIPSGVTSIGLSAFANCSGLKSIVVDANNPIYDSRENCNAVIETATNTLVAGATCTIIPTSVTSIGEQAFNSCEALTSIEIPSSITSIGDLAFQSCGFTNIICKAVTPPAIAASSFSQVNKSIPVYVPASSVSAYQTANYWSEFNNIQPIPSNDLASGVCGDNLTWKLTDEYELIIEGTGDMANFSPYGAPWNSYIDRITSVTISEGITSIGMYAFGYCSALNTINLPESLTYIGACAFESCTSLASITLPGNLQLVNGQAFYNCSKLASITCKATTPPTCNDNCFDNVNNSIPVYVPKSSINAYQAANHWKNFTNIQPILTIVDSGTCGDNLTWKLTDEYELIIEGTGDMANFSPYGAPWNSYIDRITSVTISEGITSIGMYAFGYCSALNTINLPESLTYIGACAFESCTSLASITLPRNLQLVNGQAFYNCSKLASITCEAVTPPTCNDNCFDNVNNSIPVYVPKSSINAYQAANHWKNFTNIQPILTIVDSGTCGDNLTWKLTDEYELIIEGTGDMYSQGSDSWSEYNEMIKTVTFSEGVTSIGNYAFSGCSSLTSITLPESITSIGKWGFYGCSSLTSITLPESVTSVGSYTFSDCSSLTTITIPENSKLTSIGGSAFSNCTSLTAINIPEGVTSIESNAFSSCSSLTAIIIPENSKLTSIGGKAFSDCNNLATITLPEGVTSIETRTFSSCSSLISITIPENVTSIMSEAFNQCSSLTAITIPENSKLTSIEMGAFTGCSNLTSITIPESVKAIEAFTFSSCSSLISFAIPKSASSIGEGAFAGCSNLTSITIPESVTNIGEIAFVECGKLASVTSLSSIAPTIASDAFASISSSAVLTIPSGSTSSYEDAGWTSYFSSVVEIKEDILATSLSLDVTEASLAPNETLLLSLKVTLLPEDVTNPLLSWSSSNESVATVDANGVVTAVADGEATIIVSTTDGSELSASCVVYVTSDQINWIRSGNQLIIAGRGNLSETFGENPWPGYGDNSEISEITEIYIGHEVEGIGEISFISLLGSNLSRIVVNAGNEIYDSRNDCNAIIETATNKLIKGCKNSSIPSDIKTIGAHAFTYGGLSHVILPEGLTAIEGNAFSNCFDLTKVELPNSVTSIGVGAFHGCTSLESFSFPNGVSTINHAVLGECASLTTVHIPKSITSIELEGEAAFYMCESLTSIICEVEEPINITTTQGGSCDVFYGVDKSQCTLYVPSSSVEKYKAADGWNGFNIAPIGGVLVTSLSLDVTEASLAPNETLLLTATLLPEDVTNPLLSWSSSNESVATVDANGVVTAVADGEATITVSTTDGSDLSASCTVVVVTEEVVEYDNMIYFEDVTVFTNSSVSHPLQLKNTVDMTAVQFDLYLPEGVSLATDARGRYAITFNADRADNTTHTLSSALQSDGAIRVLCYSTESYEFLGSEGAIFYFPLEIAEMEDGDYDMVIKNIVLTDVSGKKYEIPSMTSTITVLNVAPGDCNGDNTIDVADIVVLANSILGNTADGFVEKAADYNADGAVDVADIVNIANYILNGNNAAARALVREMMSTRAAAAGYSFDILPFVLDAAGSKTIAIELTDPTESFTAFQCDLYLPEGISIDKDKRGRYAFSFNEERTDASYHTLSGSQQADGAVRMLCYSTDSEVFLGADGALVYIPLTADASLKEGVYEFSIASTVLTYRNGEKVTPETYKGSIVIGDGGEVKDVKLYGRYTSEVLDKYTAAFGANAGITSLDLTEALYLPADGSLTTGNPNTIVYLAEGDALANENNVVVGDESANLMLADGYAFSAPVAFNASQASYERELAEGKYGTIVLPFAPNTDDYVFYALTSVGDDALIFDEVQSPVANTPYLYKLRDGKSATQITNNEVAVSSELTPTETATWQMVGSFTNQTIAASEDADTYYYVYTSSDNQLHKVTNTLTVKPYRAYFTTNSTNGTQLAIRTRGGEETLIDATEVEGLSPEVYYDLSGRRVDNPVKGVYIVNGKKVVF